MLVTIKRSHEQLQKNKGIIVQEYVKDSYAMTRAKQLLQGQFKGELPRLNIYTHSNGNIVLSMNLFSTYAIISNT